MNEFGVGSYRVTANLKSLIGVLVIFAWMTFHLGSVAQIDRPYVLGIIPQLYAVAALLTVLIVARAFRIRRAATVTNEPVRPAERVASVGLRAYRSKLVAIAMSYVFVFILIPVLGILAAIFIFLAVAAYALGERHVRVYVLFPASMTLITFALMRLLDSPIPWGIFSGIVGSR